MTTAAIDVNRETEVPGLPPIITAANVVDAMRAVKKLLDVREGTSGDPLDQVVTFRDLYNAGKLDLSGLTGEAMVRLPGRELAFLPVSPEISPDFTPPPAVTNLDADGALTNIVVTFDAPQYHNHSYTEIWRSGTDDLGAAVKIGTTASSVYADNVGTTGVTRYYWARNVSQQNVKGPFNAVAGTAGTTGFVTTNDLTDYLVTANKIADGAVTLPAIADAAVGLAKFAANLRPVQIVDALPSLPDGDYPEGATAYLTTDGMLYRSDGASWSAAVPATEITGTITTTQIADDAITTPKLLAGAITTAKLATGAVTANEIAANAIITGKIAAGAVTASELAAAAVVAGKIATGAIVAGDGAIANLAITTALIDNGAITNAKIGALAVDAAKIADAAIVTAKVADLAVTAAKIADATITTAKIGSAQITGALIASATITAANILDATITGAKIASATIAGANIASATITSTNIASATIALANINTATITNLSALSADLGAITAGTITLSTSGHIKSGMTDYATGTGFFLGIHSATAKFAIGNSTDYVRWDGSTLTIGGDVIVTGNIVADAVTATVTAFTSTGTTSLGTHTLVQQVTITTTGEPVNILASVLPTEMDTELVLQTSSTYTGSGFLAKGGPNMIAYRDTPAAGTITYYLFAQSTLGGVVSYRYLEARETKR